MSCGPFDTLEGKDLAAVIGVADTKITQALFASSKGYPAFDKVVLLMEAYPRETMRAMAKRGEQLQGIHEAIERRRQANLRSDRQPLLRAGRNGERTLSKHP